MKKHPDPFERLIGDSARYLYLAYQELKQRPIEYAVFHREVVEVIRKYDDVDIIDNYEILRLMIDCQSKTKEEVFKSPVVPIFLAGTYLKRADRFKLEKNNELAWSNMADSRFWVGMAVASFNIQDAHRQAVKEKKSVDARINGGGRDERYAPTRHHAYLLVRERQPESGWRSRSHAVRCIQNEVLAFAEQDRMPLSKENAIRTITGWLSKMPNVETYFPKKAPKKS